MLLSTAVRAASSGEDVKMWNHQMLCQACMTITVPAFLSASERQDVPVTMFSQQT